MKQPKFKTLAVPAKTHAAVKEMCYQKGTKMHREVQDMISFFLAEHLAQMRKGPKLNPKAAAK